MSERASLISRLPSGSRGGGSLFDFLEDGGSGALGGWGWVGKDGHARREGVNLRGQGVKGWPGVVVQLGVDLGFRGLECGPGVGMVWGEVVVDDALLVEGSEGVFVAWDRGGGGGVYVEAVKVLFHDRVWGGGKVRRRAFSFYYLRGVRGRWEIGVVDGGER